MIRIATTVLFLLGSAAGFSQGMDDYYRPAGAAGHLHPDAAFTGRPAARSRAVSWERLMARYGDAYTKSRWYVGLEGLVRVDQSRLNQTFNGLVETQPVNSLNWAAAVGWVSRERWAVEAGYGKMPIHNTILISNGRSPLRFVFENQGNGLFLRGKHRLNLSGKPHAVTGNRSGLWIGAGLWGLPGNGQTINQMAFRGFLPRGRTAPDTLRLTTSTQISRGWTALAEASAEYTVRLGGRAELGFFARKNWGLGNALTTQLSYSVNGSEPQRAAIAATGSGWSFGLTLRYVYGQTYDVSRMPRIFNLKGNAPAQKTERRQIGSEVYQP